MSDSQNTTVDPTWKAIKDFPGYWVTPEMKVFKNGNFSKPLKSFRNYKSNCVEYGKYFVSMNDFQGNKRSVHLERLYIETFGKEALVEIQVQELM